MAWQGLEPWQAILTGLALGFFSVLLWNRAYLGYWNFLRTPRHPFDYAKWFAGLLAGWLVFYYSTLILGPYDPECQDVPDPWGTWYWIFVAAAMIGLLVFVWVYARTSKYVDWCAHCRGQGVYRDG